ncbi:unnamed protein product [Adineta steineri]|uniref:Uncharacterized protein n=2 Tax=Adineta steineri TaxID=433720 RepID=A0A819VJS2_9BILA|nr:unnamed protein product [Adineta steineri]CAF4109828.1 unnamed protein product [Adineta steineri]
MKILLCLTSFILLCYFAESVQPYFPSQIVFSPDNGQTIFAIDEINQRAYKTLTYGATGRETSYALKKFPYAVPDTPESEYYVQLVTDSAPAGCMYGTYWTFGGNIFNVFPAHWLSNRTSFEIKSYINFNYEMKYSNDSSSNEDYWFANTTCQIYNGNFYPCQEIYFQKNTQIPLRSTRIVRRGWDIVQETTSYKVISMGKPDDKYFDSIPKDWYLTCRDVMLGFLYYPQTSKIDLNQSAKVEISLITPPHRINGNDTVSIQWKSKDCPDCFTFSPEQLSFNAKNFQEKQTLTITRVKNGSQTVLIPISNGGGFDTVPAEIYPIYIE